MDPFDLPETVIIKSPTHVDVALRQLFEMSAAEAEEVARASLRGFISVSALHPKGYNGTVAWADGSAMLRAIQVPKGWKLDDPSNQPRIVSSDDRTAITVSSGDQFVGVETRKPQTRNDKGAQTAKSIAVNPKQLAIPFPGADAISTNVVPIRKYQGDALWIFLYHIDLDAQEVRYELSLPSAMAENDKVCDWSQRIILPPVKFGPDVDEQDDGETPDIDIQVTPKNP